jgi:transposase
MSGSAQPSDPVSAYFAKLCRETVQAWEREELDAERFPLVARSILAHHAPPTELDAASAARWFLRSPAPPRQSSRDFGDAHVVVAWHPAFQIELIFWFDSSTEIHDHGFRGAFRVLEGSSLHCEYEFDVERHYNEHFAVGRARLTRVERLESGDCRPIVGAGSHHAVLHLSRPTVTLLMRTHQDSLRQYRLEPPYVMVNAWNDDGVLRRRLQLLRAAVHSEWEGGVEELGRFCATASAHDSYRALEACYPCLYDRGELPRIAEALRRREDPFVGRWMDSAERRDITSSVVAHRRRIVSEGPRMLLAMLACLPDLESILAFLERDDPSSDPASKILDWLDQLVSPRRGGFALVDVEVSAADTPGGERMGEHLRDVWRTALEQAIGGASAELTATVLAQRYPDFIADEREARRVLKSWAQISTSCLGILTRSWRLAP